MRRGHAGKRPMYTQSSTRRMTVEVIGLEVRLISNAGRLRSQEKIIETTHKRGRAFKLPKPSSKPKIYEVGRPL